MPLITCGASLAYHGLLGFLSYGLWLEDKDLTLLPPEHWASLVSCVKEQLCIRNASGRDLVPILDSVKCRDLNIKSQNLNKEETQALVQAMETRVERVILRDVTLEIRALTEYSGQGKCNEVWLSNNDTMTRYREELIGTWAVTKNWRVSVWCDTTGLMAPSRLPVPS